MWIISWLQSQYSRLRTLAVTYYNRIISAARNAYSWARDKAENAYQRAKTWALTKIEVAKVALRSLVTIATLLVWDLYYKAKAYVLERIAVVKAVLRVARDVAIGIVTDWIETQIAKAWYFFRNPVEWTKRKSPALDKLITWYTNFVAGGDSLFTRLLALFGTDGKISTWTWLLNNIGLLITFFNHPLRFLMAFWKGYMLDFLQYALAYGLGTVKYDLPPFPDWDKGGFGGEVIIGNPPPAGASGLVPPLTHISRSGYPFRAGHPAIDLGLSLGQPVFAMHSGKVTIAGWSTVGYGFQVAIQGADWWTRYAHFEKLQVKVGDRVKAGQTIGLGDSTGNSSGNHLHLEIKYKGSFIDPVTVL